jgi:hypothetical protein
MQTIVKNEATPETTLKETRRLLRVSRRLRKAALTHAALGLELFARSYSGAANYYIVASRRLMWLHDEVRGQARASLGRTANCAS